MIKSTIEFTNKTKNEGLMKNLTVDRVNSLPKTFLFLFAFLTTALFWVSCGSNNTMIPPDPGGTNTNVNTNVDTNVDTNSNVIAIGSNIAVNNNPIFDFAENQAINNFDVDLNIGDFYAIASNYEVTNVFVEYQAGADAGLFDTSSLTVDVDNPTNRFITGNISFSSLDFENPTDEDSDNTYELAKFIITNIDGGSNSFALEVNIINLIDLSTNRATLDVNLYTSNLIDLAEVLDTNEIGLYTYQLSGANSGFFKIENNLLRTTNDLGFRNIYENDGQYEVAVNYITGAESTTLTVTINVGPLYRQVTPSAEWGIRAGFQSVVLTNNDLLIMGGDVWLSANHGLNWSEITTLNRWSNRAIFQSVVLANNDLLVMGGLSGVANLNDIWLSSDGGTNWNEITNSAPWSIRDNFQAVVLANDDILVMGGGGAVRLNDIWLSSDGGTNWSLIPVSNHWSIRRSFQAVVLGNDDILVMGGWATTNGTATNDIWLSRDGGTNWSQITASAPWLPRFNFQAVALENNDILVMGGSGGANRNNLWLSRDGGTNWSKEISATWLQRTAFQSVVLSNNDVLIMGGNNGGFTFFNDIWVREGENRNF